MAGRKLLDAVRAAELALGGATRILRVGDRSIRIEGLDEDLAASLDVRWGGFVQRDTEDPVRLAVVLFDGGAKVFRVQKARGEDYQIEAAEEDGTLLVHSYHFALCAEDEPDRWRCVLTAQDEERRDRVVENAVRYLVARVAVEDGGFALHAAGVLRGGRVFLFAGPSRSGKSTAVRLSAPARSLGDDYALVLPRPGGWGVPAVPFDNSERAPEDPPRGLFPLAGIWRLHHAAEPRVERLAPARAAASLMACTAMPWAMQDLATPLLEHVKRYAAMERFEHLHFRRAPDFWSLLDPESAA